jgi:hypothetical protein
MTSVFEREDILFQVVVNHQEQYSIWPDYKAVPAGSLPQGMFIHFECGCADPTEVHIGFNLA